MQVRPPAWLEYSPPGCRCCRAWDRPGHSGDFHGRGRDAPQRVQALGRKRTERAPCPLELVEFGQQRQQIRRDLDGFGFHHSQKHTDLYRIVHPQIHLITPECPTGHITQLFLRAPTEPAPGPASPPAPHRCARRSDRRHTTRHCALLVRCAAVRWPGPPASWVKTFDPT